MTETIDLDGLRVTLVDTAGLRETDDAVEAEGVARSRGARRTSPIWCCSWPIGRGRGAPDRESRSQDIDNKTTYRRKQERPCRARGRRPDARRRCRRRPARAWTSCARESLAALDVEPLDDRPAITNVRHIALRRAGATRRSRARASGAGATGDRSPRSSCWPIFRRRARRSRRSRASARRTMCWRTSSRGSASGSRTRRDDDRRSTSSSSARATRAARRRTRRRGWARASGSARCRRDTVGAHAVQSRGRRHGEGPSRSRDRRARRPDGPRDRRDRHSVQAAQSQPRSGGLVAARAGRQEGLRRTGCARRSSAEPNIEWMIGRAGRMLVEHGRVVGLAHGGRRRVRLRGAGRHDRHVPERPDPHRSRAASGRPGRRAAVARAGRIAEVVRLRVGPAEDRHAAAARSREHRLRRARSRDGTFAVESGRRSAGAVLVPDRRDRARRRSTATCCTRTIASATSCARTSTRSPLFNGQIQGIGPRYCPSLEDKIVRFPDKERHQIFLEPEGLDAREIYVNGFSMSLPRDVQAELVHALPGLEDAVLLRPGYAVEYDFIQPTELTRRARDEARRRAVSRRADQRHVGLRGGGGAGARGRHQRRAGACDGLPAFELGARRGVHRHPGRRPDHEGLPRAVPDVHLARRASAAAADRQRRSAADAARPRGGPRGRRALGAVRARRRGRFERNLDTLDRTLVRTPIGRSRAGEPAAAAAGGAARQTLLAEGSVSLDIDAGERSASTWRASKPR